MAVASTDLTQPKGELDERLFPGLTSGQLTSRLEEYITDGVAQVAARAIASTDADAATKEWAYYRAYHSIGLRLLATPRQATIEGQGSRSFDPSQAEGMFKLANDHKAAFEALVPEAGTPSVERPGSVSFRHGLTF